MTGPTFAMLALRAADRLRGRQRRRRKPRRRRLAPAWVAPSDLATRDLFYGLGADHADPDVNTPWSSENTGVNLGLTADPSDEWSVKQAYPADSIRGRSRSRYRACSPAWATTSRRSISCVPSTGKTLAHA